MKKGKVIAGFVVLAVIFLFFSFILTTTDVAGDGNNSTTTVTVNVTNTPPVIYNVSISDAAVDLNPGNTTLVNCTGLIYDANGYGDILIANATLYHTNFGMGSTTDNNYRYINSSCSSECIQYGGGANNASCTCMFAVWYYANNGTWQCNMTVADSFNLTVSGVSSDTAYSISPLVALDLPIEIDFGNLSVTETSAPKKANVTNYGNLDINISVRGFGGSDENTPGAGNFSLLCQTGNISNGWLRYHTHNDTLFQNMINLTNASKSISSFDIPQRTEDLERGNSSNSTYWRLKIPFDVGGFCNGTILFSATETNA